eukprot:SAG31_NODE_1419_length_8430_cov_2.658024_5_plen_254_part_00
MSISPAAKWPWPKISWRGRSDRTFVAASWCVLVIVYQLVFWLCEQTSEWVLLRNHASERANGQLFGVQVCGGNGEIMGRLAELLDDQIAGSINTCFVFLRPASKLFEERTCKFNNDAMLSHVIHCSGFCGRQHGLSNRPCVQIWRWLCFGRTRDEDPRNCQFNVFGESFTRTLKIATYDCCGMCQYKPKAHQPRFPDFDLSSHDQDTHGKEAGPSGGPHYNASTGSLGSSCRHSPWPDQRAKVRFDLALFRAR